METLDYWTPADALAFRCAVEAVGTLRPREATPEVAEGRADQQEARRYAVRAMRALARLAEGEGRTALEAARTILERAYGPALAPPVPAPDPASAPALPDPQEHWPPWLTEQRLRGAYIGHANHEHTND